jgi:hypothetical protein
VTSTVTSKALPANQQGNELQGKHIPPKVEGVQPGTAQNEQFLRRFCTSRIEISFRTCELSDDATLVKQPWRVTIHEQAENREDRIEK